MILVENGVFKLDTPKTTYLFRIAETGHPVHLYYGEQLGCVGDISAYAAGTGLRMPTLVNYSDDAPRFYTAASLFETSSFGKGDLREAAFLGESQNGQNIVFDFTYDSWHVERNDSDRDPYFPSARKNNAETLVLSLSDKCTGTILELRYTVYHDSDVIIRSSTVINNGSEELILRSLCSLQLDMVDSGFEAVTLSGAWSRERQIVRTPLTRGTFSVQSSAGLSSAEHNPLLLLESGRNCYLINLLWSGDHRESVEVTPYGTVRVLTGINPEAFSWKLNPGERFASPEAMIAYSPEGENTVSHISHDFICRYIAPQFWKDHDRPVLLNSWEGMGFDISEEKILRQASCAADLGIELFVIDDGWFRPGLNAVGGLGDWEPVKSKFPNGLSSVTAAIHDLGMSAGIWVEPECISIDSELYRTHPEFLVRCPGREPSPGRDQYLLDLTRDDVINILYAKLEKLIAENRFDYVKWDMNRYLSDDYSPRVRGGEFRFRWMRGLYRLLGRIRERFPHLLLEGCSSGGSRFDLGMLCFFDQIWGSDNTDATDRVSVFSGTSLGYPQRSFGAHVSRIPNGITGRVYDYETAFSVNAFGAFGYELNVEKLSGEEFRMFRDQIGFYKQYRALFQFGTFDRVSDGNTVIWTVRSEDGSLIIALYLERRSGVSQNEIRRLIIPVCGNGLYRVATRRQWITAPAMCEKRGGTHLSEAFSCVVPGELLRNNGMALMPVFLGTEYKEDTAFLGDYGARLFIIEKKSSTEEE